MGGAFEAACADVGADAPGVAVAVACEVVDAGAWPEAGADGAVLRDSSGSRVQLANTSNVSPSKARVMSATRFVIDVQNTSPQRGTRASRGLSYGRLYL